MTVAIMLKTERKQNKTCWLTVTGQVTLKWVGDSAVMRGQARSLTVLRAQLLSQEAMAAGGREDRHALRRRGQPAVGRQAGAQRLQDTLQPEGEIMQCHR